MIGKKQNYYSGTELSPEGLADGESGDIYFSTEDGSVWNKVSTSGKEGWIQIGSITNPLPIVVAGKFRLSSDGLDIWNSNQNAWNRLTAIGVAPSQTTQLTPV